MADLVTASLLVAALGFAQESARERAGVGLVVEVPAEGLPEVLLWPDANPNPVTPDPRDVAIFETVERAIAEGRSAAPASDPSPGIFVTTYTQRPDGYGAYRTAKATFAQVSGIFSRCTYSHSGILPPSPKAPGRVVFASTYDCPERSGVLPVAYLTVTIENHALSGIFAMPDRPFLVAVKE